MKLKFNLFVSCVLIIFLLCGCSNNSNNHTDDFLKYLKDNYNSVAHENNNNGEFGEYGADTVKPY